MYKKFNFGMDPTLAIEPCKLGIALEDQPKASKKLNAFFICFTDNFMFLKFKIKRYVTLLSVYRSMIRSKY